MEVNNIIVESFIPNLPKIGLGPGSVVQGRLYNPFSQTLFAGRLLNKITQSFYYRILRKKYKKSLDNAFKLGYRLIDYSSSYGSGELIGSAIKKCGIPREELFITTRVSNKAQFNHTVRDEFLRCLHHMGLDYIDLLQFHWPVENHFLDTWREMEKLKEEGLVKHLGVANCHQHHLEEIYKICKYRPEIGQFEIHPLFTQKTLIQYYKDHSIIIEAYTPLARYDNRLVKLPLLKRMEQKYNKSLIQIILRWHIQNGVIPIVRSLKYAHQKDNISIFDFELDDEDMRAIDGININSRLRYDPDNCDFSIL